MKKIISIYFFTFFCIISSKIHAQAPSNDECSNAKLLSIGVNETCTPIAGTLKGATNSTNKNDCIGQEPIQDVWYKFTASTSNYFICLQNVVPKATQDAITIEFYQDCNDITPIYCLVYAASGTGKKELNFFIPGTTYYIRVVNSIPSKLDFTFDIGVSAGFPPPPNDFCNAAIPLTINPTLVAKTKTLGNFKKAVSTFITGNPCQYQNYDVWYSFVAKSDRHRFEIANSTPFTGTRVGIYEGSCTNLKWVTCLIVGKDADESTAFNLTVGKKYFVQCIADNDTDQPFSIAITTPPPAPDNDYFTKAQTLAINQNYACSKLGWGTTFNASPYAKPDIWYKFKATSTSHQISFHNIKSKKPPVDVFFYNTIFFVYATPTPSSFFTIYPPGAIGAPIGDFKEHHLDYLTIGDTYYINVVNFDPENVISFEVCVSTASQTDTNIKCQDALEIPTNPTNEPLNTLHSSTIWENPDWSQPIRKSWYYFTATNSTHIFIEKNYVQLNKINEPHSAFLYPNQCPLVNWIVTPIENKKELKNLTVGEKYFINLEHQQNTKASYELAITTPKDTANNTCDFSKILEINNNSNLNKTLIGDFSKAKIETLNTPCEVQNPTGKSLWYAFDALAPQHEIQFIDAQKSIKSYEIWEGERCDKKQFVYCSTNGIPFTAFNLGKKYYLRVISDGDKKTTFQVGITTNNAFPKNDNCSTAVNILPSLDGNCTQLVEGNNFSALPPLDSNVIACNQYDQNNDIWFSFVANSEKHMIKVSDVVYYQGKTTDLSYEILENSCSTKDNKPLFCIDNPTDKNNVFKFQVGKKYYLRFYGKSYNSYSKCKFKVCISTPPKNDTPEFAEVLPAKKSTNSVACPKTAIGSTFSSTYDPNWKFFPYYCKGMDNVTPADIWFKTNLSSESKGFWFQFVNTPTNSQPIVEAFIFENNEYQSLGSICGSDTLFTDKNGEIFIRIWDGKKGVEGNYEVCLSEISKNAVDINEPQSESLNITVFPNPTNGILYFDFKNPDETYNICIYSIDGVLQLTEKSISKNQNNIDINHLQSGAYILKIENKTKRIFKKVVKI
jgi:large repetitive protein